MNIYIYIYLFIYYDYFVNVIELKIREKIAYYRIFCTSRCFVNIYIIFKNLGDVAKCFIKKKKKKNYIHYFYNRFCRVGESLFYK